MAEHFADRLISAVLARGAPCAVALDPVYSSLPAELTSRVGKTAPVAAELSAILEFSRRVLRVIVSHVPVVKINSAYFERYHADGVSALDELIAEARRLGLLVLADVKRGDVGHTAEMYADACLGWAKGGEVFQTADAVTISGYFGRDGAAPFIESAKRSGKGVFVLVRTSNPSAAHIQDVQALDGRKVHEIVAAQVAQWADADDAIGKCGYSLVGAVVATRNAADARRLREIMPRSIFLVPGYGAQGGRPEDFQPYFCRSGGGALIVAGRSVIFAHSAPAYRDESGNSWEECVERACRDFVADICRVAV